MTSDAKEKQRAEEERWRAEAQAALEPRRSQHKGSHHYPSVSGSGTPAYKTVPPLGHRPTFRKLHE